MSSTDAGRGCDGTLADADGFARHEPFAFALGAFLLGLPGYWASRSRMTAPHPVPPPTETR